jgi:hypothetical protein
VLQSAAEEFNEDPMDRDEDYVDIEDQQPAQSRQHKQETKGEAQRLYESWQKLLPSLVLPFLTYMNKSASRLTANTFELDNSSPCTTCPFGHSQDHPRFMSFGTVSNIFSLLDLFFA